MQVTIYHNPRCSKSRETLERIRAHGIEPEIIEYLQAPPTEDELRTMLAMLGKEAIDLVRRKESEFAAAGLDLDSSEEQILRAMNDYPILLERPIVVRDGRAVVGRPPEAVETLLG